MWQLNVHFPGHWLSQYSTSFSVDLRSRIDDANDNLSKIETIVVSHTKIKNFEPLNLMFTFCPL